MQIDVLDYFTTAPSILVSYHDLVQCVILTKELGQFERVRPGVIERPAGMVTVLSAFGAVLTAVFGAGNTAVYLALSAVVGEACRRYSRYIRTNPYS